jgi:hypothetical protein
MNGRWYSPGEVCMPSPREEQPTDFSRESGKRDFSCPKGCWILTIAKYGKQNSLLKTNT